MPKGSPAELQKKYTNACSHLLLGICTQTKAYEPSYVEFVMAQFDLILLPSSPLIHLHKTVYVQTLDRDKRSKDFRVYKNQQFPKSNAVAKILVVFVSAETLSSACNGSFLLILLRLERLWAPAKSICYPELINRLRSPFYTQVKHLLYGPACGAPSFTD